MFFRVLQLTFIVSVTLLSVSLCSAQISGSDDGIFGKPDDKENSRPKNFKETLEKLRIEHDQKEFDKMIQRGETLMQLTADLEKSYDSKGHLTDREQKKIVEVEKLAKKIRDDLGGDDDDKDKPANRGDQGFALGDAVKALRTSSVDLYDELKKTTRFTISAAAIQTSNAVLNLARFLKLAR